MSKETSPMNSRPARAVRAAGCAKWRVKIESSERQGPLVRFPGGVVFTKALSVTTA